MQLIKNPKFLEEYNSWNEKLSMLPNQDKKDKVLKLIRQLMFEIKKIDDQHANLTIRSEIGNSIKDSREIISSLRKKIHSELENI